MDVHIENKENEIIEKNDGVPIKNEGLVMEENEKNAMIRKKDGATDKKDELAVSENEENLKVDEMIENDTMKNEIK